MGELCDQCRRESGSVGDMKKKTEIIAGNSMYQTIRTYREIETSEDAQEAAALSHRDADREFAEWAEDLQAELKAAGWPLLSPMVQIMPDNTWMPIDDEFRRRLNSGDYHGIKLERGSKYIEQRVEPHSHEYFLWKVCDLIHSLLRNDSQDLKIIYAYEIGRTVEIGRAIGTFGPDYEIRIKNKRAFAEDLGGGREKHRQEVMQKASKWRAEARTIAKEKWHRNPAHSTLHMARLVQPELRKRGIKKSVRTIREAIGEVKPKG